MKTAFLESKFEEREEKTREKMRQLEDMGLEKKLWSMTGEVTAKQRPLNSLLEADIAFQQGVKVNHIYILLEFDSLMICNRLCRMNDSFVKFNHTLIRDDKHFFFFFLRMFDCVR